MASRHQFGRLAALAAFGLSLSACATSRTQHAPGPRDEGRAFVMRACAGCHAVGQAGASRNPDAPPFRALAAARGDGELLRDLQGISQKGHVEMPPIYITPDEMAATLAYLHGLRDRGV